jgi:acetyl-CoA carboxylase carboxyl transferase subunit alpha
MSQHYLDFEEPIRRLDEKILELRSQTDPSQELLNEIANAQQKRYQLIEKVYSKLNRWQRVQLARHPNRPYSLDYIKILIPDFIELHGDRYFSDDPAVVTGIGHLGDRNVVIIGQQKGRNTKENLYRNFGMMKPEGYRKALRVMKIAEKFCLPIVTLMDTPGAYPGIGAEERGQAEAIAKNIMEMSSLQVPIVGVVIGEGASGGALGIGICDRFLMMENTWYSVISPEGCASILFRDVGKAPEAAESLKVVPSDVQEMGICDRIIQEPNGGAHRDKESAANNLNQALQEEILELDKIKPENFMDTRIKKYDSMGNFMESK